MERRVLSTMPTTSARSAAGTANLSSVLRAAVDLELPAQTWALGLFAL